MESPPIPVTAPSPKYRQSNLDGQSRLNIRIIIFRNLIRSMIQTPEIHVSDFEHIVLCLHKGHPHTQACTHIYYIHTVYYTFQTYHYGSKNNFDWFQCPYRSLMQKVKAFLLKNKRLPEKHVHFYWKKMIFDIERFKNIHKIGEIILNYFLFQVT